MATELPLKFQAHYFNLQKFIHHLGEHDFEVLGVELAALNISDWWSTHSVLLSCHFQENENNLFSPLLTPDINRLTETFSSSKR